jgi:hypothetical protein
MTRELAEMSVEHELSSMEMARGKRRSSMVSMGYPAS